MSSEHQNVDLAQLQGDQKVYGSDGQELGEVAGLATDINTGEQYLGVEVGLFKRLYIPKSAIVRAVLGEPVRLNVSAEEARDRFADHPNLF